MFTLEEVKKAIGGRLISKTDEIVFASLIEVKGVSTDTRTIKEGELFIALKGENFDGNDYLAKAFELGACALVTNDEKMVPEGVSLNLSRLILILSKLLIDQRICCRSRRRCSGVHWSDSFCDKNGIRCAGKNL